MTTRIGGGSLARWLRPAAVAAAMVTVAGLLPAAASAATGRPQAARAHRPAPGDRQVCGRAAPGFAACMAIARTGLAAHRGLFAAQASPQGYGPDALRSAYNLPSTTAGAGATVAVVDAYDDPDAASDLDLYRQQYGLPACTTANGCFRKVAQDGRTAYPLPDGNWAAEISLDLDMVSAICPNCHILLVEAKDNSSANLGAAVDEAVKLGAKYVSNSYGGPPGPGEPQQDDKNYDHPGVAVTVAAGDTGYGVYWPAASQYVTSVGGTSLKPDHAVARGWAETAWAGTSSGCAEDEPKPSWQHDTGCVGRTETDVSADADPDTGVAVYDTYPVGGIFPPPRGWNVYGGTSVSSPVIASVYALAGAPFDGSDPASYPYADPSGLHDVTSGSDGACSPAYLCTAGPGYDGPTGLGTPDGVAAFTRPHGTLAGTITDASTGRPLAGVTVLAGTAVTVTGADGQYRFVLPAASYDVTALGPSGYAGHTASVAVSAGQSVTENFALRPAPYVALSGQVTDGSGHGWPLYARVSVPGTSLAAYTDPGTGRYTLRVPQTARYPLQVQPGTPGYQPASTTVTVGTQGLTSNISDPVDTAACTAPGYRVSDQLSEDFTKESTPPGWTVVTPKHPQNAWVFNQPDHNVNATGGSGNFAIAFEAATNDGADTALVSPVVNLSHDSDPVLRFDEYAEYPGLSTESIDVSVDGGKTWTLAWDFDGAAEDQTVTVPLPQLAGLASVRLRFVYQSPPASNEGQMWELDDITLGGCAAAPGGLVTGLVTDANTGLGVNGATVTGPGQPPQPVTTVATPGDPRLRGGLYWLFSGTTGRQPVTAAASGYTTQTSQVTLQAGQLTRADFALPAGRLAVSPGPVTARAAVGSQASAKLTVTNTGTAPVTVTPEESWPGGSGPAGISATGPGAPVQRISGHFDPQILRPAALARYRARPGAFRGPSSATPATAGPGGPPWQSVTGYPQSVFDVAAATDPVTGRVYAVGGQGSNGAETTSYMLDPATGRWDTLPPMSHARGGAQAAFIDGQLYVTGGYDNDDDPVPDTEIYDPALRRWSPGASIPHAYFGAATAVLNGRMYVVGGCDPDAGLCGETSVQVYDPVTNRWSSAAPYPASIGWASCGAIAGQLYCAGGVSDTIGSTSAGYVYDPATDRWSPIPHLPVDLWGSAYTAANGQLLVSGGVADQSKVITNQGFAFNPAADGWSPLPDNPAGPTFRGASACGLYQIGGAYDSYFDSVNNVDRLAGYDNCGGQPWLSTSPAQVTLGPGKRATITVSMNAASPAVPQPGSYAASLQFGNGDPYPVPAVPVTLTATAPARWGELAGTVTGQTCSGGSTPLAGATVQVNGGHGSWTLTTDHNGRYQLWLDASNSPATLIASQPGWQAQSATAAIRARAATTRNFTLRPAGCG